MMPVCKKMVLALCVFGLLMPMSAVADEGDVVAIFRLRGPMTESPSEMGIGALLGDQGPPNMFGLLKRLREARSDNNVRAVIFDFSEAQLGYAQVQELRQQMQTLKAANKDVWIFADYLDMGRMLLCSAAERLILMPTGEVMIHGMYGEGLYFKNLLEHLGLKADILHCGDYKAAGEPFTRTGPSKFAERQNNALFDSLFETMVRELADSRGLTEERVRELIDMTMLSAKEAHEAGLVDKLQYRGDFVEAVKDAYGEGTKVVSNYGKKEGPDIDFGNPFAFFQVFSDMMKGKKAPKEKAVAVVFVEGPITTGRSEPSLFGGVSNAGSDTVRRAIAEAQADDKVRALVLRVDSPGGSAIASDVIAEAVQRFGKTGRPVIVSMGNVAASGGYYVSCLADQIIAQPSTITGSIGVVGGKIITEGFWDWVGVTSHEYVRGKHADLFNTNREFSEAEKEKVFGFMVRVYEEFKGRVIEGRGDRIKGDLEPLAGGRIYSGKDALAVGLVDKLGGFADAIETAAVEAGLGAGFDVRVYPRPKNFMEILSEAFGGEKQDDEFVDISAASGFSARALMKAPHLAGAIETIATLDPAKARAIESFLLQVELLGRENVLLLGPGIVTVNP